MCRYALLKWLSIRLSTTDVDGRVNATLALGLRIFVLYNAIRIDGLTANEYNIPKFSRATSFGKFTELHSMNTSYHFLNCFTLHLNYIYQ